MNDYEKERAIENIMADAMQEIIDSGNLWFPSHMAFAARRALLAKGYEIRKLRPDPLGEALNSGDGSYKP